MEIENIAVEEQSEDSVNEEEISSVDDIVEIERTKNNLIKLKVILSFKDFLIYTHIIFIM